MRFSALMSLVLVSSGWSGAGVPPTRIRVSQPSIDTTTTATTDTTKPVARLTVRPRDMATGTETKQAGVTPLDGLSGYYVYVPPQCVGTTRSPLVVLLHGGGRSGLEEVTKFQRLADKYGMILLAASALRPGRWDVIGGMLRRFAEAQTPGRGEVSVFPERDIRTLDTAIIQVLRTHAIDPDRMALTGFSDGGSFSLFLGRSNLDIFSRIAPLSPMIQFDGIGPPNPRTQFFLSGGMGERNMPKRILAFARTLRGQGHAVITQIGIRSHADYLEDEEFVWAWLRQSWADPEITTRVPLEAVSDPVLTEEVLRQMTAFWTRFQQVPDSIRTTGRMHHQIQVPLTIGSERTTVVVMNVPAMAVAYPSIAALLDSVGLTAAQAMAYRTAIIRTGIAREVGMTTTVASEDTSTTGVPFVPITPAFVLGRNLEFWKTHEAMFTELEKTKIWVTQ